MEAEILVDRPERPPTRRPVNQDLIYKLALIHCTDKEIGSIAGIHVDSLRRHYRDIITAGRQAGRSRLRRRMWEEAMAGNTTMMIWLSKNYLAMTDAVVVSEDKQPLPWSDSYEVDSPSVDGTPDSSVIVYTEFHENLEELEQQLKEI